MAWTRKYLIVNSIEMGFNFLTRIGVKHIKLISSPSHTITQDEDEQAKIVPNIMDKIKINFEGVIKIKKRKIYNFHRRGMNPIAYLAYLFIKLCRLVYRHINF